MAKTPKWKINGELTLSCSCDLFCPCVISLGEHKPTEGDCKTWIAIRIDDGYYGDIDLSGQKIGLMVEIPGLMGRGDWRAALFIDKHSDIYSEKALIRIFSGKAGGSTGLFRILVSQFIGVERVAIDYKLEGKTRHIKMGKFVEGSITPVAGKKDDKPVKIRNSKYWIAPNITVAVAEKSRLRAYGRVWDFNGKSSEICKIKWSGP